jgi:hypothetical protein
MNNNNTLLLHIKNTICDSLKNGNSVLLKPREGVIDYSYDVNSKKPFENIQQLYMQQIRKNNNFLSPYFLTLSDVLKNHLYIKNNSFSVILPHVNKLTSKIEYINYFNTDQLDLLESDIINNPILNVGKKPLSIPYVKDVTNIPPVKSYNAKYFSLYENFLLQISEYFKSIYTGTSYSKPGFDKNQINRICSGIHNFNFFKNVNEAHLPVKNSLSKPVKQIKKIKQRSRSK